MEIRQKERLEAYLRNSGRFLWGVCPGNQKTLYQWLGDKMHVQFTKGSYDSVIKQLLNDRDFGIEKILTTIVVPTVKEVFPEDTINYLRKYWSSEGHPPNLDTLRGLRLNVKVRPDEAGVDNSQIWRPFVEINTLYNHIYVEGWGELAPIFFEEIEPWLKENRVNL